MQGGGELTLFVLLALGIANWLATTIIVEGVIFEDLREAVRRTAERGQLQAKLAYFVTCHLCAGTWIALLMALFVAPLASSGIIGIVLTALAIRGVAHLVLLLNNMGNAWIDKTTV